ncbi:RidA family protein [Sterolibacterium denitrificans]|nr:RidA family protein [Sterolibacterium denitrificans]
MSHPDEQQILQPADWLAPRGYVNGIAASGRLVFISGQVGWDAGQVFRSNDLLEQIRQTLQNILTILAEAGGEARHLVRLVWYLRDKAAYQAQAAEIGAIYRAVMGRHYPTMSVVEVAAFLEDQAQVEIEATAVIPAGEEAPAAG